MKVVWFIAAVGLCAFLLHSCVQVAQYQQQDRQIFQCSADARAAQDC